MRLRSSRRRGGTRWVRIPAKLRKQLARQTACDGAPKRAKYGNRRIEIDGHRFASKREAAHYQELKVREAAGEIRDLVLQPAFELHAAGPDGVAVRVGEFTPDFSYWDVAADCKVVVDVKSKPTRTEAYMLRKRLFEAAHGIPLTEVF